jgi:hypothetical protein
MIEKILKSTFEPTLKQLKEIRNPFFSNGKLERYGDSFVSSYKLEIYSKEIKEYVRIKNREEKVIVTACEENIKELFGKKIMEFFHIFYVDKLETKLSTKEYFKKILHKNEKITFHQDNFDFRFKDNENDFSCKLAWAEYRHYQLGAFYIKKNQPYEKEYEQLRNQYKNETLEFLEKFKKIEEKQRIRKLMKML